MGNAALFPSITQVKRTRSCAVVSIGSRRGAKPCARRQYDRLRAPRDGDPSVAKDARARRSALMHASAPAFGRERPPGRGPRSVSPARCSPAPLLRELASRSSSIAFSGRAYRGPGELGATHSCSTRRPPSSPDSVAVTGRARPGCPPPPRLMPGVVRRSDREILEAVSKLLRGANLLPASS